MDTEKELQHTSELIDSWYGGDGNPKQRLKNMIMEFAIKYADSEKKTGHTT